MNKETFLAKLRNRLGNIRPDVLEDIIFDFEEHFLIARESGASEEEICAILGDPDEIAKTYFDELSPELTRKPEDRQSEQQDETQEEYDADGIRIIRKKTGAKNPFVINIPPIEIPDVESIINNAIPKSMRNERIKIDDVDIDLSNLGETIRKHLDSNLFEKLQRKLDRKAAFTMNYNSKNSCGDRETPVEACIELDGVNTIELEFRSANISIEPSDDDKIHYSFENSKGYKAAAEILLDGAENGRKCLSISGTGGGSSHCKKCAIKLPQSFFGEFNARSTSGDISINNVKSNAIFSLRSVSGNVSISSCEADITPKSVSGDIEISGLTINRTITNAAGEKLAVGTSSGDISIARLKCDTDTELTSSSGDISVEDSCVNLRLRTGSGNIKAEGLTGDAYVNAGSGNIKIRDHKGNIGASSGSGNIEVSAFIINTPSELSTGSGNIRLSAKEISSPVTLNSSIGNIHVKSELLRQPIFAKTNMGDIKAYLGVGMNLKFDIDAEQIKNRRSRTEANPQYPDILLTLIAKHGQVVLEDLE